MLQTVLGELKCDAEDLKGVQEGGCELAPIIVKIGLPNRTNNLAE